MMKSVCAQALVIDTDGETVYAGLTVDVFASLAGGVESRTFEEGDLVAVAHFPDGFDPAHPVGNVRLTQASAGVWPSEWQSTDGQIQLGDLIVLMVPAGAAFYGVGVGQAVIAGHSFADLVFTGVAALEARVAALEEAAG